MTFYRLSPWSFLRFCGVSQSRASLNVGKIILTIISAGRRHGPARTRGGPESDGAARVAVPEPASRAGHRSGVPCRRSSSTPATRCRSSTRWCAASRVDGAPVTATAAAFGYSRPSYYQAAAALAASGLDGLVPARPGPRGGHKLTGADPGLGRGSSWRPIPPCRPPAWPGPSPRSSGCACTPAPSSGRWPAAGSTPKAADPSAPERGQEEARPCPCDLHLAARLLNRARHPPGCRPGSCSRRRAGRPLRAAAPCRPARTRDRVPARARRAHRQGRHRLAARPGLPDLRSRPGTATPACRHRRAPAAGALPGPVATELVHVLAAVAVALAGT